MGYSTGEFSSSGTALSVDDLRRGVTPVSTQTRAPTPTPKPVAAAIAPAPIAPTAVQAPATTAGWYSGYTGGAQIGGTVAPSTRRVWGDPGYAGPSSGGGGGGGTAYPMGTPQTAVDPMGLQGATNDALQAEIAALEAQYGLTLAQIAALGGEIGARAQMLLDQLAQQEKMEQEDLISSLLQRGVYRSGMTAADLAQLADLFAGKRAEVEFNKTQQLGQLELQRGAATAGIHSGIGASVGQLSGGNTQAELAQMFNSGQVPSGIQPQGVQTAAAQNGGWDANGRMLQAPKFSAGGPALGGAGQNTSVTGAPGSSRFGSAQLTLGGGGGGGPIGSDAFRMMRNTPEGQFTPGHFLDQGGEIIPNIAGNQQGAAQFGTAPLSVDAFIASLSPMVKAGLTEQDLKNIQQAYGSSGIPTDAAYGIASRASYIGTK